MNVKIFGAYLLVTAAAFIAAPSPAVSQEFDTSNEKLKQFKSIIERYETELKNDPKNLTLILALGEAYHSLKDYPKSIAMYKRALFLNPTSNKIKILLANSYLANYDEVNSRELYTEVLKEEPDNVDSLGGLGRIEALEYRFRLAEGLYKRALEISPRNTTVLYYLADLKIDQKEFGEAQAILEKLMKKDPEATWIQEALLRAKQGPVIAEIQKLEEKGNLKEAIYRYKQELAKSADGVDYYLALARVYSLSKSYPEAIAILKKGIKLHPSANRLNVALGFAYIGNGELSKAKQILEFTMTKSIEDSEALSGLGKIAALSGDYETAEKYYLLALKENPNSFLALSSLAALRSDQKKYGEAEQIYRQILQMDPNANWAKQALKDIQYAPLLEEIYEAENSGRFVEAEKLYKELLAKDPLNLGNYLRFGNFYRLSKNYQSEIQVYLKGLDFMPRSIPLLRALGFAYLNNGELFKGEQTFLEVLEYQYPNVDALVGLGRVKAMIGDVIEAEKLYDWGLEINPSDETALSYLADLRMEEKRYGEAIQYLQKIQQINPKASHPASWVQQEILRAQNGQGLDIVKALELESEIPKAIVKLEEMLTTSPQSIDLYAELGRLNYKLRRYKKALEAYERGLRIDPKSSTLLVGLGLSYLALNDVKEAKKTLELALLYNPRNSEAIASLGSLAAISGDKKAALYLYEKALAANPSDPTTLSYFANYWMEEKEYEKAKELYKRLLQVDSKAVWVKELIQRAESGPILKKIVEKESSRNFKEAEALYKELIAKSPKSAEFYIQLGKFYLRTKRYDDAIVLYFQGLKEIPGSNELQIALAYAYVEKGEYDIAKGVFGSLINTESASSEALAGLGKIAESKGDDKEAELLYQRALVQDENAITALNYLAELYIRQGQFEKSEEILQKLSQIDPGARWIKLALTDVKHGNLLSEIKKMELAKDFKGAEILYGQLLREEPNPDYYLRFALFYHHEKQYDKAIDIYLQGLKIAPNSQELYAGLGLVYLSKKDPKKAKSAFLKALKINPANADALAGMGSALMLNKRYIRAENYILRALASDPKNDAALSSLGNLRMIQKRYGEAADAYKALLDLQPKEKWIRLLYENAINGKELEEIKYLIEAENLSEAARRYGALVRKFPDNPYYSAGLGLMYLRLKQYGNARDVYIEALKTSPEENELLVSLGYSYLFMNDLDNAWWTLNDALTKDGKNPEALAGMGRVTALQGNECLAEELYLKALAISPINQSALTFYGLLLMKQKRFDEAVEIITRLKTLLPAAEWVARFLKDAEDGPVTEIANDLADQEEFELAAEIYSSLIASSPGDPARYEPLGQMYVNLGYYWSGICVYQQGLEIDDEAFYLLRAIGMAYILLEEYDAAESVFEEILEQYPDDAESWAGLGRIEALTGSYCLAEYYSLYALSISPDNITTLGFWADLKRAQGYYCSALGIYAKLREIDCGPKWIRTAYRAMLNETMATIKFLGGYHGEWEWDRSVHQYTARYQVYGGGILINYPVCDDFTLNLRLYDEYYNLKDIYNNQWLYSIDVDRVHVGSKWIYCPNLVIDARIGWSTYSRYKRGSFCVQEGTIVEPGLMFTYQAPIEKASFAIWSDSNLVARDFSTNRAKLVGRYYLEGAYERHIIQRGWIGFNLNASWYNDYVNNSSQSALGWFQWRPPCYTNNIMLRYHLRYGTFAKNIPDYYTYKAQWVNYLQLTLEKYWRVCWADTFYTSLAAGAGLQNTLTKFAQFIVLDPTPDNKQQWDNRVYGIVTAKGVYTLDQLQMSLLLDYYIDTEKYTMGSVVGELRWRF